MEDEKILIKRTVKRGKEALYEFIEKEGIPDAEYSISYSERGWDKVIGLLEKIKEYGVSQKIQIEVSTAAFNTLTFKRIMK